MRRLLAVLVLALLLPAVPAAATTITYSLTMSGAQEIPGPGDLDGSASGTLTIDDSTGLISWNFTFADIDAPTAMHIHGPGGSAGNAADVFVGLNVTTSGGAGTLISTTTSATNAAAINANPTDFYVNIHTALFGAGAVRGQLGMVVPEPGTVALLVAGALGLALSKRRSGS